MEPHQQAHFDGCMRQAAKEYQAVPSGDDNNRVSVSSLSEEMRSLVKAIQRKQAELRHKK